ncbi:hypothetical protein NPIL_295531, partial [Nephila pilipes]
NAAAEGTTAKDSLNAAAEGTTAKDSLNAAAEDCSRGAIPKKRLFGKAASDTYTCKSNEPSSNEYTWRVIYKQRRKRRRRRRNKNDYFSFRSSTTNAREPLLPPKFQKAFASHIARGHPHRGGDGIKHSTYGGARGVKRGSLKSVTANGSNLEMSLNPGARYHRTGVSPLHRISASTHQTCGNLAQPPTYDTNYDAAVSGMMNLTIRNSSSRTGII